MTLRSPFFEILIKRHTDRELNSWIFTGWMDLLLSSEKPAWAKNANLRNQPANMHKTSQLLKLTLIKIVIS